MRPVICCLALIGLAACSATPAPSGPLASRDVACLNQQGRVALAEAMAACHTQLPDLTGDLHLQAVALNHKIPFTIRPEADAAIKDRPRLQLGSLIPEPPSLYPETPVGPFGSDPDLGP
ncbi:hypothetical protein NFI95_07430 [Acetobacteraceae bacterium KSS8]|uniref:Secreted protein n=1 Tax=Endosaccharibacter trunci TaxID=2812733 RepID=A0ABT1W5W9_9PROT|nr:hypothetical protein [Acetobacteraceae bacterium KSS8]